MVRNFRYHSAISGNFSERVQMHQILNSQVQLIYVLQHKFSLLYGLHRKLCTVVIGLDIN